MIKILCLMMAMALAGCSSANPKHDLAHMNADTPPGGDLVQLRSATLPFPLRQLAVHYCFVVYDAKTKAWSRWEVWQNPHACPTSWGHVHKNLNQLNSGVGGGPCRLEREWRDQEARAIMAVLNRPETYPYRNVYRAWPGPNSNTYPLWILEQAGIALDPNPMAIGKDYQGIVSAQISPTRTGVQAETPIIGLKLGLRDGVEVHPLCLTIGLDFSPPALKTPFGRFGFREKL